MSSNHTEIDVDRRKMVPYPCTNVKDGTYDTSQIGLSQKSVGMDLGDAHKTKYTV